MKIVLTPLLDDSGPNVFGLHPHLTSMDFAIWGILARKACEKPHSNVASLKRSLKKAWAELDEETICNCCANAHKRLVAVVEAEGGYIESK